MNQLRKYRIQLNELIITRDANIQREKNIYKAELERIAIKSKEFNDDCHKTSGDLKMHQLALFEELNKNTTELEKVNNALSELQDNKFKLRGEILLKIQAENQAKKDMKRNSAVFNNELLELNSQIQQHKAVINNYTTTRRQINEDYYNWRDEKTEINTKLSSLDSVDRKYKIMSDYLAELENDIRAQPDKRYIHLEQQLTDAGQTIAGLEYQANKIKKYMATFKESTEPQELIISSYLRETKAKLPELKQQQTELTKADTELKNKIAEYDDLIKLELTKALPTELIEQTHRANMRIEIATSRIKSEYDPLLQGLRCQIQVLETELTTNNHTEQQNINSGTPLVNIYTGQNDTSTSNNPNNPNNTGDLAEHQPIDFSNKSRKEIERLKKQMLVS